MRQGREQPKAIVGLLIAQGISVTGSRVTMVALPWLVLVMTGSAAKTGLVAFAETLPYVLAAAFGGPLISRLGGRRVGVGADLVSTLVLGAIVVISHAGLLSLWLLMVLVALFGFLRSAGDSAKRVLLPDVVARSGVAMERATSLTEGIARLALLLGAPLAGLLAAIFGPVDVLFCNMITFPVGACVLALATRRVPTLEAVEESARPSTSYVASLRVGIAFVRRDRLIRGVVSVLLLTNLFDQAFFSVLLPVWVRSASGTAAELGLVAGALGLGAVLGNAVFAVLAPKVPRFLTFAFCLLVGGAPRLVVMALTDSVWVMVGAVVVTGLAASALNPIVYAVAYQRIPRELQANVFGLAVAVAWAGIPLGGLIGGWALQWLGFRPGLLALAAVYLVATLVPFFRPVWRELDRPGPKPPMGPVRGYSEGSELSA